VDLWVRGGRSLEIAHFYEMKFSKYYPPLALLTSLQPSPYPLSHLYPHPMLPNLISRKPLVPAYGSGTISILTTSCS